MRWRAIPAAVILAALAVILSSAAPAQQRVPGVTGRKIVIGSCSALDGPEAYLGLQTTIGAKLYFDRVNDQGGVNGRKIEIVTLNDSDDPGQAAFCLTSLMQRANAFAAAFFVGTPPAKKYVAMAQTRKIPILGFHTGAELLYEPVKRYIFSVRASYFDEAREEVDHLWNDLGVRRIGVIYQNDSSGRAVLAAMERALAAHHAKLAGRGSFTRGVLDVNYAIGVVHGAKAQAVILAGPYAPAAEILKQAHGDGWHPLFLAVSTVGTQGLIRAAGSDAEGTVVTQVVPPYDETNLPTVKLYRQSLEKYMGNMASSFVGLEGFVDAMVLVKGLERAGRHPTREKLISALESIHNLDMGLGPSFLLNYSAASHQGFDAVVPTVIRGGKPVVLTDWKSLRTP